jgi:S1-C subfamily serine protease
MKGLSLVICVFSIAIIKNGNRLSNKNLSIHNRNGNIGNIGNIDNGNGNGNGNDFMSIQGNGVCRVEVAKVEWDALQPWQRSPQSKSTGTAFVIDGERLLTNAHVVKSAIDIRVRPHGSTRRFPAKVVCYAPDVDLALLEILGESERADFFGYSSESNAGGENKDTTEGQIAKRRRATKGLEFATELPALQETVHVVGFPTGGRTICVTEGVVSRIDLYNRIVAIQVDSAINPGNSGGPVFNSRGQVTG